MAQTTTISQKELKRQAAACFEGKTLKVMLCSVGATGYTAESTVTNWQSVEQSGNGYVRYSTTIGTGAYDATTGTYKLPDIDASFTATSTGYTYDRVVLYINGETYIHSLVAEDPAIVLSAGQTQTYRLSIRQDD
jgi:hypothetical protein